MKSASVSFGNMNLIVAVSKRKWSGCAKVETLIGRGNVGKCSVPLACFQGVATHTIEFGTDNEHPFPDHYSTHGEGKVLACKSTNKNATNITHVQFTGFVESTVAA